MKKISVIGATLVAAAMLSAAPISLHQSQDTPEGPQACIPAWILTTTELPAEVMDLGGEMCGPTAANGRRKRDWPISCRYRVIFGARQASS